MGVSISKPSDGIAMTRRQFVGSLLATGVLGVSVPDAATSAERQTLTKEESLALFLLNCAYYGTWPTALDPRTTLNLRIAITGKNTLNDTLSGVIDRAKAPWFKNGTVEIITTDTIEELRDPIHIVLVESAALRSQVLARFQNHPTLLVSTVNGFASEGGTIGVATRNRRLRFVLNLDSLERSQVKLQSRFKIRAAAFIRGGRRVSSFR